MINKIINFLQLSGLTWFVPLARLAAGEDPKEQMKQLWMVMGIPIIAFVLFLFLWAGGASKVETSLGKIPGPAQVMEQAGGLWEDHKAQREKADAFYERQDKRNALSPQSSRYHSEFSADLAQL